MAIIPIVAIRGFAEGRETWDVLDSGSIPLYGLFLIVVCGTVFFLIARRAIKHKVLGHLQIVIIMTAVSIPTLLVNVRHI